jgi:hypothetical protein
MVIKPEIILAGRGITGVGYPVNRGAHPKRCVQFVSRMNRTERTRDCDVVVPANLIQR